MDFEVVRQIGEGAYSRVFLISVGNNQGKNQYAMKVPRKPIKEQVQKEAQIAAHFDHPNIIRLRQVIYHRVDYCCLITDYMENNLKTAMTRLTLRNIPLVMCQILRGLKTLHSANVWHRDLKPENILVNGDNVCKIADFGMAVVSPCSYERNDEYVTSRHYRAPEVLFGGLQSSAMDIWAVGCILLECYFKQPIFPGSTTSEQRSLVCRNVFDNCMFSQQYIPFDIKQLAMAMLVIDVNDRINAHDALQHSYLSSVYLKCPSPEVPDCSPVLTLNN